LLEPVTVAANTAPCPPVSDALVGVTEIDTAGAGGVSDIAALAVLAGLAALVAVTVTVCADAMLAGAVYTPLIMLPTAGEIDQFTPRLLDPLTLAVSVVDCP
jgi:hypothetical protein